MCPVHAKVFDTEIRRGSYKSLPSKVLCYTEFHAMCDLQATKDYSVQLSFIWHPRVKNRCHFFLVRQQLMCSINRICFRGSILKQARIFCEVGFHFSLLRYIAFLPNKGYITLLHSGMRWRVLKLTAAYQSGAKQCNVNFKTRRRIPEWGKAMWPFLGRKAMHLKRKKWKPT